MNPSQPRHFRLKVEEIHEGNEALDVRLAVWPPEESCPEVYVTENRDDVEIIELDSSELKSWETNSATETSALREAASQLDATAKPLREVEAKFTVDYFDFPMIDNTRLSNDQRCAVVIKGNNEENNSLELLFLYFPGSHASLKAKPYFSEIMKKLIEPTKS